MAQQRKFIIILLGPPGAGKGTVGQRWAAEWGWQYIATGDLLREAVRRQTPLGLQAKAFMERGELVPDEVMDGIVEEALQGADRPLLLDGYPRTVAQAEALTDMARRLNWKVQKVVLLQVGDAELIDRLSARRVCPHCQAIYNLRSNPPKDDERCDRCGTALVHRDDDKPDVIEQRLTVYRKQTQPVVDYYRSQGLLTGMDASGLPEEVYKRLEKVMLL